MNSLKANFSSSDLGSDLKRHGNVLGGDNITDEAKITFEAWHEGEIMSLVLVIDEHIGFKCLMGGMKASVMLPLLNLKD